MAPPPKARAKRGNASRYCCGSGHVQRQGGSPLKANVSTAKHRSASAAVAVSISASAMIPYVHLYATVFGSLTAQFLRKFAALNSTIPSPHVFAQLLAVKFNRSA